MTVSFTRFCVKDLTTQSRDLTTQFGKTMFNSVGCQNAKHSCDMSVESNFTFDLIFLIHRVRKKWFPIFSFSKI